MSENQTPTSNTPTPVIKLSIKGVGPVKEGEITIHNGPTLLYGPNGSGKSTILRVLDFVLRFLFDRSTALSIFKLINNETKEGIIKITINEQTYSFTLTKERVSVAPNTLDISKVLRQYPIIWVKPWSLSIRRSDIKQMRPLKLLTASKFRSILSQFHIDESETEFASMYKKYVEEVSDTLFWLSSYNVELIDNKVFFKNMDHYYTYEYTADGVKWMYMISASIALANLLKSFGRNPIVFVEAMETSLHYDHIGELIKELIKYEFPIILETHSGFALKLAYRGNLPYYVFEDGHIYNDLSSSSLFKSETASYEAE